MTSTSAGSGFYGNILVGDPPPASTGSNPAKAPHASPTAFDDWAHLLGATTSGSDLAGASGNSGSVNGLALASLAPAGLHAHGAHGF